MIPFHGVFRVRQMGDTWLVISLPRVPMRGVGFWFGGYSCCRAVLWEMSGRHLLFSGGWPRALLNQFNFFGGCFILAYTIQFVHNNS